MDISCIDKISEAVIKLVLIKGHLNEVYHVINPHGLMIRDILNLVQECEENGEKVLKELSVEEIYNYYEQANIKDKEWIKQLVFECQIVQDIGRNTRKIKVDKTVYILEKLGLNGHLLEKKNLCQPIKKLRNFDIVQ